MIVIDASATVSALLNAGPARTALSAEQLNAPHLIDTEVASALRRQVAARHIPAETGWAALATLRQLGLARHPSAGLAERIWELRDNLSAYDASYVALAEALGCGLLTADGRLSQAPGLRCPITVVPR